MTNGEIARRLEDVIREMRSFIDRAVLREVYEVQQKSLDSRVTAIERERQTSRKMIYSLAGTVAASVVAQVLIALLNR